MRYVIKKKEYVSHSEGLAQPAYILYKDMGSHSMTVLANSPSYCC